eukprot:scaffold8161_cov111-Cylindrotheca_fusiformis.AAC.11
MSSHTTVGRGMTRSRPSNCPIRVYVCVVHKHYDVYNGRKVHDQAFSAPTPPATGMQTACVTQLFPSEQWNPEVFKSSQTGRFVGYPESP